MNSFIGAASLRRSILGLLEDHVELGLLECRYESEVGRRRLFVLAFVALCLVSVFVFIQVVLTIALLSCGLPLYAACLVLALFWAAIGLSVFKKFGQRDSRVPEPFEGTRQEWRRSLQWIQKNIS